MYRDSTQRVTELAGTTPQPPVTLSQVKQHLRVDIDDDDDLLQTYLFGAVDWAETTMNRAVSLRQFLVTRDRFPVGLWRLPMGKVASIESVEYIDDDGVTQTWDGSPLPYELDNASNYAARLRPARNQAWPTTGDYLAAARVTINAGWTTTTIPYEVRQSILLKVGSFYESRVPGDADPNIIDKAATDLLLAYRLPPF